MRKKGKLQALDVTVLMGDHRLPDQVKRDGTFNPEDHETVRKLKDALAELPAYKFRFLDNHATLERDLSDLRTDLVFNLCDEGWNNDPFKELHVPALLEVLGLRLHRRGTVGAGGLLRQGPGARRGAGRSTCRCRWRATCGRATRVRRCRRSSPRC